MLSSPSSSPPLTTVWHDAWTSTSGGDDESVSFQSSVDGLNHHNHRRSTTASLVRDEWMGPVVEGLAQFIVKQVEIGEGRRDNKLMAFNDKNFTDHPVVPTMMNWVKLVDKLGMKLTPRRLRTSRKSSHVQQPPAVSKATVETFLRRAMKRARFDFPILVSAFVLLRRLVKTSDEIFLTVSTWKLVTLTAIWISQKVIDDNSLDTLSMGICLDSALEDQPIKMHLSATEGTTLEREFLVLLSHRVFISSDDMTSILGSMLDTKEQVQAAMTMWD